MVRAMPNTPAAVRRGITVAVANQKASAECRRIAGELLAAVGDVAWIDDEAAMDAVTAVSGSGPAYVFSVVGGSHRSGNQSGIIKRSLRASGSCHRGRIR